MPVWSKAYIREKEYQLPSHQTRTAAGKVLIDTINNAKKSVDFAFYGLAKKSEIVPYLIGNVEVVVYFSPTTHALDEGILPELRKAKKIYKYKYVFNK